VSVKLALAANEAWLCGSIPHWRSGGRIRRSRPL